MADYAAPVKDMALSMRIAGLEDLAALPGFKDATTDVVLAVIDEAARLGARELAPLNQTGDREGAGLTATGVVTPTGVKAFYRRFVEGGWNAMPFDPRYGGQGLPGLVSMAAHEIWESANMAFALCPMLTMSAADLLSEHGSEWQKKLYLAKLVSGEWTGTMNLTEPQAGSDLSRIQTRAAAESHPQYGEIYRITGQKIFITYGDHDLTENIVHLVLARTPDAPEGVKGLSLFLIPKVMVGDDGSLGERNDAFCVSIERKLGIHASPTATMAFGEGGGAVGYLIGEENGGLACMFTMMNAARLGVGLQGCAIAERALQHAARYARDRVQSRPVTGECAGAATIVHHPDVRRMLLTMRSLTEASRHLCYLAIGQNDIARRAADKDVRAAAATRVALLTPLVKTWGSEVGVRVASLGVQVFGGMGFIEDAGAAQFYRDARIAPIYEGANGVQTADLVGRKVRRDGGAAMMALLADMRDGLASADATLAAPLGETLKRVERVTRWVAGASPADAYSAAAPFCELSSVALGGCLMAQAATLSGEDDDRRFATAKAQTAAFFVRHILPHAAALEADALAGGAAIMAMAEQAL